MIYYKVGVSILLFHQIYLYRGIGTSHYLDERVGRTGSISNNDLELSCYKFAITTFPLKAAVTFISQNIPNVTIHLINCLDTIKHFIGIHSSFSHLIQSCKTRQYWLASKDFTAAK